LENIGDLGGINAAYDGLQLYDKTRFDWWHTQATFLYFLDYDLEN
jgi:predicted metalloendopeptidase